MLLLEFMLNNIKQYGGGNKNVEGRALHLIHRYYFL